MRKPVRKGLILAAKVIIGVGLLWFVLQKVEWGEFIDALTGITIAPAGLAAGCFVANFALMAYRWRRLLGVQDVRLGMWEAIRLTWLGTFFNFVVLGTTGGDLARAWYSAKHTDRKAACLLTVFVDRLIGLTGLTLLSVVMLAGVYASRLLPATRGIFAAGDKNAQMLRVATYIATGVFAGLIGACAFVFSRRLRRWLHLEALYQKLPMAKQLANVREAVRRFRSRPAAILRAMGQTLMIHLLFICGIFLLAKALGLKIPWHAFLTYIPLIYIAAAVPISPGGLGAAEVGYVMAFSAWASNRGEIIALALLARLLPMFLALPGVIVAVRGAKIPPADQIEAEMAGTRAMDE